MRKELIFSGLVSLMFASCSNDTAVPVVSQGTELGLTTRIASSVSTRSLTEDFVSGDQIGVFIKGTSIDGNTSYEPHLAAYTCPTDPTGVWTSPTAELEKIYLANVTATVYAFYPYAADGISNSTDAGAPDYYKAIDISVPATQQFNATDVSDYMYATTREGSGPDYTYPLAQASNAVADATDVYDNKVNLYMHHALSKLSFVVNKDESYVGAGKLSQIVLATTAPVTGSPKFQSGALTMSLEDGTITGTAVSDELVISGVHQNMLTKSTTTGTVDINDYNSTPSTTVTSAALVAPLGDTSGITLKLTIDGKEMSVVLPADAANNADTWLAEKNYTYTITVKGTELIVSSVSILPWTDIDGGSADVE